MLGRRITLVGAALMTVLLLGIACGGEDEEAAAPAAAAPAAAEATAAPAPMLMVLRNDLRLILFSQVLPLPTGIIDLTA